VSYRKNATRRRRREVTRIVGKYLVYKYETWQKRKYLIDGLVRQEGPVTATIFNQVAHRIFSKDWGDAGSTPADVGIATSPVAQYDRIPLQRDRSGEHPSYIKTVEESRASAFTSMFQWTARCL